MTTLLAMRTGSDRRAALACWLRWDDISGQINGMALLCACRFAAKAIDRHPQSRVCERLVPGIGSARERITLSSMTDTARIQREAASSQTLPRRLPTVRRLS